MSHNDINKHGLLPFHEFLVDGNIHSIEEQSGVIPFQLGGEIFNEMFILVGRTYTLYSRFVNTVKDPLNQENKVFKRWEESARKDVEHAFQLLKRIGAN